MQRNIRRRNEQSFWAPIPVQFEIYRLSFAGSVAGLQVPSQRNLKLLPYVLGEAQRRTSETSTQTTTSSSGSISSTASRPA